MSDGMNREMKELRKRFRELGIEGKMPRAKKKLLALVEAAELAEVEFLDEVEDLETSRILDELEVLEREMDVTLYKLDGLAAEEVRCLTEFTRRFADRVYLGERGKVIIVASADVEILCYRNLVRRMSK